MIDGSDKLRCIAEFCRSSQGVPVKQAIERMRGHHDTDRRVEYFRGEKLVTTLLGEVHGSEDQNCGISQKSSRKSLAPKRPFSVGDVEEAVR